ncbi:MAG: tryptophan--tRNA ligase, partial [archaeon]
YMRRGIIYGHRDFRRIAQAMKNKKPFIMLTGLMPSGKMHLGHKMVADEMVYFQEMGAHCYVCVADVEAYLTRGMDAKTMKELAVNEYLLNYIALGLKPERCTFYFQSDFVNDYNVLSKYFAKKVTFNELRAIYGELTTGKIVSALTQAADILYPQIDMGKPTPTVVPVGTDQDPHLRLTRDIAARFKSEYNFILPSSTYHKYQKGLTGAKMSSSDPTTYIALTDTRKDVESKVKRALTGGRDTLEEQKRLGGQPQKCTIFDLYKFHLVDDDAELGRIYDECASGKIMCGECKKRCIDYTARFLEEHQKKREKAKEQIDKFLVK